MGYQLSHDAGRWKPVNNVQCNIKHLVQISANEKLIPTA